MAKKVTTFYTSDEVAKYLEELPDGDSRSKRINEMLSFAMRAKDAKFVIPLNFDQVSRLLSILYERRKEEQENENNADPMDVAEYEPPEGWVYTADLIKIVRTAVDN